METRFLTQSRDDETPQRIATFEDEAQNIEVSPRPYQLPAHFLGSLVSVDGVFVMKSRFSLQATLNAEKPYPSYKSSKLVRIRATEKLRKAAAKAKRPGNIEELQELVSRSKKFLPLLTFVSSTNITQKLPVGLSPISHGY